MREFAITVIGRDRTGIIADTSGVLADLGLNLTDSTMTRLRGHFAMTLVCSGDVATAVVEEALTPLTADASLVVSVREVGPDTVEDAAAGHYVLSLHGADRLGIVAAVARLVADADGNITDLTTRLAGELYVLVAEVDLPASADVAELTAGLTTLAAGLGVEATLRRVDADLL